MAAPADIRTTTATVRYKNVGRVTDQLSDGSLVALVKDEDNKLYLYRSTDRETFTLALTITLTKDRGYPGTYSMVVDSSNNIYVTYVDTDNDVRYFKLTASGFTWTKGSETVVSAYTTETIGGLDIDKLDSTSVVIAINYITAANSLKWTYAVLDTGGSWTVASPVTITGATEGRGISICRDDAGASANIQKFAVMTSGGNNTKLYLYVCSVNISNGVHGSRTVIDAEAFGGHNGPQKKFNIFCDGPGQWAVAGIVGFNASATVWAATFSATAYVDAPVSKNAVFASVNSDYADRAVGWASLGSGSGNGTAYVTFREEDGSGSMDILHCMTVNFRTGAISINSRFDWYYVASIRGSGSGGHNHNLQNHADVIVFRGSTPRVSHVGGFDPPDPTTTPTLTPANTAVPTCQLTGVARFYASPSGPTLYGPRVYAEFTIASDSGFTADVVTVLQDVSDAIASGTLNEVVPDVDALPQGVWYIRARLIDEFGRTSSWSSSATVTLAHPPTATPISPVGFITLGVTNRFSWEFSDTWEDDEQTEYNLAVEDPLGATLYDTGWIVSANHYRDIDISASVNGTYRWKVRLKDLDGAIGPWSDYGTFSPREPGTVTVSAPTGSSTVATPNPTVEWSFTPDVDGPQRRWQVGVVEDVAPYDNIVYTASGTDPIGGPYTISHTLQGAPLDVGTSYIFFVTVTDTYGVVDTGYVAGVLASWTLPDQPTCTVDTATFEHGATLIEWDDTDLDPAWECWRVYRKTAEDEEWTLCYNGEIRDVETSYQYFDGLGPSQVETTYAVVQVINVDGALIESSYEDHTVTVTPVCSNYFLIRLDTGDVYLIEHVTAESFSAVSERAEIHLIGRGRKVEVGDRIGYAGSITGSLRDVSNGRSAREQRILLQEMIEGNVECYLKNPFGDVWKVSMGDASVTRIAGTGLSEAMEITLPYMEIF